MTIRPQSIKAGAYCLGGSQFIGHNSRSFSVRADTEQFNELPIEMHIGTGGLRAMVDMSIEEAEALAGSLATALRLRRIAEERSRAAATKAARTFFADPDGTLEAA